MSKSVRPRVVISHITGTGSGALIDSNNSGIFSVGTMPTDSSAGTPLSPPPRAALAASLKAPWPSGRGAFGANSAIQSARSALLPNTSTPAGSARPPANTGVVSYAESAPLMRWMRCRPLSKSLRRATASAGRRRLT